MNQITIRIYLMAMAAARLDAEDAGGISTVCLCSLSQLSIATALIAGIHGSPSSFVVTLLRRSRTRWPHADYRQPCR